MDENKLFTPRELLDVLQEGQFAVCVSGWRLGVECVIDGNELRVGKRGYLGWNYMPIQETWFSKWRIIR